MDKEDYVLINNHNIHIYRAGDENKPKLIFMSGSGTVSPVYDFKILYSKLVSYFRVIVIEKFGYGYSDLFEAASDIDSVVDYQREALGKIGEKGPFILVPHSMSGLEAIRWKQKYPKEVAAIIGIDMGIPSTYIEWSSKVLTKKIVGMRKVQKIKQLGILDWYPLNKRGLNKEEIKQQRFLWKRNAFNNCFINEAEMVLDNAMLVDKSGKIESPVLLFVSDGKQICKSWIKQQNDFAQQVNAEIVQFNCGHYIHYYESENMSAKIISFCKNISSEQ